MKRRQCDRKSSKREECVCAMVVNTSLSEIPPDKDNEEFQILAAKRALGSLKADQVILHQSRLFLLPRKHKCAIFLKSSRTKAKTEKPEEIEI
jgi:hypothetical protein